MTSVPISPQPTGVRMQWNVRIPLRDGIHLSAILYLPETQGDPAPTVFTLTPYVAQSYHDRGTYFAARGVPFLAVDARGRGNSEGVFACYGNEAEDGYDIVEWIAGQPYCNGKVAMWGGSYGGFVQWAAASQHPPHLATIVPVAAPYRGLDSPMRNNIIYPHRVQWLTLLGGRTSQDKIFADQAFWSRQFARWFKAGVAFKDIDTFLGHPSPILQGWLKHPAFDDYWQSANPTPAQYAAMSLPVLTITGSYDGDQPGALAHYRRHLAANPGARHYLIIGPWDHAGTRTPKAEFCGLTMGPASLVDLPALHCDWYAWTMGQGPKPAFLKNNVAYYVMGADTWRYADTLDAVTARTAPLYLGGATNPDDVFHAGTLEAEAAPASAPHHYRYDPRDVSDADLEVEIDPESRADQRLIHARVGKQLVYHSAPFDADTEVSGFFRLKAWIAIDQPDTDFIVQVWDLGADGKAVQLTNDIMRARYRDDLTREALVETTEPLLYDFNRFYFTSRLIRKGHRLRLVIGPINSIHYQKNYNSGRPVSDESTADARTVTVRLLHGPDHPSALYIPYGAT